MPKGETVRNVVIDGKRDDKGGTPENISQGAEEAKREVRSIIKEHRPA